MAAVIHLRLLQKRSPKGRGLKGNKVSEKITQNKPEGAGQEDILPSKHQMGLPPKRPPKSPKLLSLSLLTSPHLESGEKDSREGQNPNQGIKRGAHQGGSSKKRRLKRMRAITRILTSDKVVLVLVPLLM